MQFSLCVLNYKKEKCTLQSIGEIYQVSEIIVCQELCHLILKKFQEASPVCRLILQINKFLRWINVKYTQHTESRSLNTYPSNAKLIFITKFNIFNASYSMSFQILLTVLSVQDFGQQAPVKF